MITQPLTSGHILFYLLQPSQARFVWRDSNNFWDSVGALSKVFSNNNKSSDLVPQFLIYHILIGDAAPAGWPGELTGGQGENRTGTGLHEPGDFQVNSRPSLPSLGIVGSSYRQQSLPSLQTVVLTFPTNGSPYLPYRQQSLKFLQTQNCVFSWFTSVS